MARMTLFSSPFLLGFDDIERLLERASKSAADGYPPYNIERLQAGKDGERLRIVVAVAGFARDELEVTMEDNELIIRGKQKEGSGSDYLHRGIAARHFQRTFVLADGLEVKGALIENGLLIVDLFRPEPQRLIRKIEIRGS